VGLWESGKGQRLAKGASRKSSNRILVNEGGELYLHTKRGERCFSGQSKQKSPAGHYCETEENIGSKAQSEWAKYLEGGSKAKIQSLDTLTGKQKIYL